MYDKIDIKETNIYKLDSRLFEILLIDRSSKKNLIWATNNYAPRGFGFQSFDHITVNAIIRRNGSVIKPRVEKSKKEQASRVKDKAEVFTPSWICNAQNNLIDNAWFGKENVFNIETDKGWIVNLEKITFPEGKSWQDYVKENRLEITCGEAPYRILMGSEFSKEDIIAFYQFTDIVNDQKKWDEENFALPEEEKKEDWANPYYGFPQMVRFAFVPNESSRKKLENLRKSGTTYAFSALFKPRAIKKVDDGSHY